MKLLLVLLMLRSGRSLESARRSGGGTASRKAICRGLGKKRSVRSRWGLRNFNESRKLAGMDSNSRKIGDLVTIVVEEQTATSLDAGTETANSSKTSAGISALLGAETTLPTANQAMAGKSLLIPVAHLISVRVKPTATQPYNPYSRPKSSMYSFWEPSGHGKASRSIGKFNGSSWMA